MLERQKRRPKPVRRFAAGDEEEVSVKSGGAVEVEVEDEEAGPSAPTKKSRRSSSAAVSKHMMAFQSGAFVLRLSDVEGTEKDCIWRVESHQLLQRWNPTTADKHPMPHGIRTYTPTSNYTGWYCLEGEDFLELLIADETAVDVSLMYPTQDEIAGHWEPEMSDVFEPPPSRRTNWRMFDC